MKIMYGVMVLACAPAVLAGNDAPYPKEKVAGFVVEKLDVTTLPSVLRPKRDKRKKTFGDYGYITRQLDEKDALVETAVGDTQINIRVLDQRSTGIYVCIEGQGKSLADGPIQRVFLLRWKKANSLLAGRESSKEFDGCPEIGVDPASGSDSYGG